MIIKFNTYRSCFISYGTIIEVFNNKLNSIFNNIKRQIRVIFMELLRKFNVQIVNKLGKLGKFAFTCYYLNKAEFIIFPGNLFKISNNFSLIRGKNC